MGARSIPRTLPDPAVAIHRQSLCQESASDDAPLFSSSLTARRWQAERARAEYQSRRQEATDRLYELRRGLAAKLVGLDGSAKGLDAMAELLDEKPSYTGTLSRCLNRAEESRRYQIDWDAPVLLDRQLGEHLLHGLAAIMGVEITIAEEVTVSDDDVNKASREVLRDLERVGIDARAMLNRKLGVKPGTVKL